MKLNILAFGAHPDDVELGAAGTLAKHAANGDFVGIVDLTRGEMGSRGTPEIRAEEAKKAGEILGCKVRLNLGMRDGFIENNEENQMQIIQVLRKYKPDIVLCNAPEDRHPDHGNASKLVADACFKSGLFTLKTKEDGHLQEAWRPKLVYHYIQYYSLTPDLVVDVTGFYDKKIESVLAHKSQFYNANSKEPKTVIASKNFLESIEARSRHYGQKIYTTHAEGFIAQRVIGVNLVTDSI